MHLFYSGSKQRNTEHALAVDSPWGRKEQDTTKRLSTSTPSQLGEERVCFWTGG